MIQLSGALRLYLVADPEHVSGDFYDVVEAALRGGVTAVQLRAKQLHDSELLEYAKHLRRQCSAHEALFFVNDRVDIALASGADGVHLGVDDLPIEDARKLGGSQFIIGYSPDTNEQLESASTRGVDYLGIGPVFGTRSKSDAGDALGLAEFSRRVQLGRLPSVGIGGITICNAASVLESGANGVAVLSAILKADDPEAVARQLSRNS